MVNVINECQQLIAQGVKEIHLLGQNVNAYNPDLVDLINNIAGFDEVLRIRFTTSHPADLNDAQIKMFADEPKLAAHLHLPVQSGSDIILKAMRRSYTVSDYKDKIRELYKARPNIYISSDFIVGFPGETEADFEATLDLVREIEFDNSFSFMYSPRPGTPAAIMPNQIPLIEKQKRLKALQDLLNSSSRLISQQMFGKSFPVLVTGQAARSSKQLTGRTESNRTVNFVGAEELIGQIVQVEITEILLNSFRGRMLSFSKACDEAPV
jgi:tRNA-2-methylthio-N6-dimethylallyladenosine synthase